MNANEHNKKYLSTHEKYIKRCIELAKKGLGNTYPNPNVGCVIVHNNTVIGEGYTSKYGGAHAEVNAIQQVSDKKLLQEATLYVTLEPCAHYGKTPPCADLIVKHKIPNVVIGVLDSNTLVAGKGVKKLIEGGCNVTIGVLEDECRELHKRFLTYHTKKRPFIILKWAQTIDGYLAPKSSDRNQKAPVWITNTYSRQLVHQWRSQEHAILVGTKTVLEDNPKLTTRQWSGYSPIRVVLDQHLKIDTTYNIFNSQSKVIVITGKNSKPVNSYPANVLIEQIDFTENLAHKICNVLYKHQIQSVIIEGGSKTLQTFITENLWDEARIFTGKTSFGSGVKAPTFNFTPYKSKMIGSDTLNYFKNND